MPNRTFSMFIRCWSGREISRDFKGKGLRYRFAVSSHLVNACQCVPQGILGEVITFGFLLRESCQILSKPVAQNVDTRVFRIMMDYIYSLIVPPWKRNFACNGSCASIYIHISAYCAFAINKYCWVAFELPTALFAQHVRCLLDKSPNRVPLIRSVISGNYS